eukprot:jgi/Mesvir1/20085/Mv13333-RA.1
MENLDAGASAPVAMSPQLEAPAADAPPPEPAPAPIVPMSVEERYAAYHKSNPFKQKVTEADMWFEIADTDRDGRLIGKDAVAFFQRSRLPKEVLQRVWQMSDIKRQGFLSKAEFGHAMELVYMAQNNQELTPENHKALTASGRLPMPQMLGMDELMVKYFERMDKEREKEQKGLFNPFAPPEPAPETLEGVPIPPKPKSTGWQPSNAKSKKKFVPPGVVTSVVDGLKRLYLERLEPLEQMYRYDFFTPKMAPSDFEAKPMVMLLGQYSTGAHIGPEPTTDRFVVIYGGPEERTTPGNTLAVQADKPFTGLTSFGTAFLSKFQGAQMPHPLLDEITFIDTPGVLSGEKQRTERSYDFTGVVEWFAGRCDMVLLLFDPHKLDISDEFKRTIMALKGHDDKIRIVLNKADQVHTQQLMRVYGALMWSLGKVLGTPEVTRVYIGSFNDKPTTADPSNPLGGALFTAEQNDLLNDLRDIPKKSCDRKVNEFVKRARSAKIHALICNHLRSQMPSLYGRKAAQDKMCENLAEHFNKVRKEYHLPAGDFPDIEKFRNMLQGYDLSKFDKLKPKMIEQLDEMLSKEIPDLLQQFNNPYDI